MGQAFQCAVGHRPQRGAVKADHFGGDLALVAGAQLQPVADGSQAGQSLHFDHEAKQVGDGAADPEFLNAFESRNGRVYSINESEVSY